MTVVSAVHKQLDSLFKEMDSLIEEKPEAVSGDILKAYRKIAEISNKIAKYGESAIPDLIQWARKCTVIDHRLCIINALGHIGSHNAIEFLTDCLESEQWLERLYASEAIAELNDVRALDQLKVAFKKETMIKTEILNAITKLEPENPELDLYLDALKDNDFGTRREAIQAIRHLPGMNVRNALLDALHDPQMGVVYDAAKGLKPLGSQIVEPLIEKLTAKGKYTRMAAAELLGEIKDEGAVKPLCEQLLKSKNKALRAQIAVSLAKIKSLDALPDLCRALKDHDHEVREAAAQALGILGAQDAVADLVKSLNSNFSTLSGREKEFAAISLGKINSDDAISALIEALDHEDSDVRLAAAKWLLKRKVTKSLGPMKKLLKNEKYDHVRKDLEAIIYKLSEIRAKHESKSQRKKTTQTAKASIRSDLQSALTQLKDSLPANRRKGISFIVQSGDKKHVKKLYDLIFDQDASVRKKAAEAIRSLNPTEVLNRLQNELPKADGIEMPHMIEALGIIGNHETIPLLFPYMQDEEAHIRRKAKTALNRLSADSSQIRHNELKFKVNTYLKKRNPNGVKKMGIDAILPLREILIEDKSADIKAFASAGLDALDWEPVTVTEKIYYHLYRSEQSVLNSIAEEGFEVLENLLQGKLYPREAVKVAKALASVGKRSMNTLISALQADDHRIRNAAVEVLAETGLKDTESFIELLHNEDANTIASTAELLGKLGEVKAVPVLVELLRKECNKERSEKDEPGFSIAKALGRLKDKKAVPVLIECMSTQHAWARGAAVALGEMEAKEAIPALKYAMKNDSGSLGHNASLSLKKMGWEDSQ